MATSDPNAPELLRQEILEQARQQREAILGRASQAAEAAVAKARHAADQSREERLAAARAEAARRVDALLATVPVEAGRRRATRIEHLLQTIHDRAAEQLRARAGLDWSRTLTQLLAEALGGMEGDRFRLRLSATDSPRLGDGLNAELRRRTGRSTLQVRPVTDPHFREGEAVVEDETGRQVWDLTLDSRLERCWPELRRQIAAHTRILEQGTA